MLPQLLANGLILGSVYAMLALGFSLVYNTTRILHIAYAVLYMICPYIFLTFHITLGLGMVPSLFISLLATAMVSGAMEAFVYQPLTRNKSSLSIFTVSSIGIMLIFVNLIALLYGSESRIINPGVPGSVGLGNIILVNTQIVQLVVSLSVVCVFMAILHHTRFGTIVRAMRDNNLLCSIFALNMSAFRIMLFGLSGLLAGLGGFLVANDVGMDPYVGMAMFLNAIVASIIGGVGTFKGPIIGGFIIGILQALAIWQFSSQWQSAVTFILLIAFLLARPQGLLGEKQRLV